MVKRQRSCVLVAMVVLSASSLYSQSERPVEVYVGYSNLQGEGLHSQNDPNNLISNGFLNDRTTLHGVNAAISFFPFATFGLTGDLSFNRKRNSTDVTGGTDSANTDIWYFMAGPTFTIPGSSRFQPFARVMAGAAHTAFEVEQGGAPHS